MRLFVAALGVIVAAGTASAQYPSVAAVAGTPTPPGPGAVIVQNIAKHPTAGGYFMSNAAFGDGFRNNGAGSVYSDYSFAFGSTRSFFAPCGPFIGEPCGPLCGRKRKDCPPAPPCEYGSYNSK